MVKFKIKSEDSMPFFNDLTILRQIVPHLSIKTLRALLKEVKQIDKRLTAKEQESSTS